MASKRSLDKLSQLQTREAMDDSLEECLRQASASGNPFAIVIVDIDHFKGVNDSLGHLKGDAIISGFAERVRSVIAKKGVGYRYGGDEFLITLENFGAEEALALAERLRSSIAGTPIDGLPITATLGVAVAPDHGSSAKDLIGSADKALYAAKGAGRNAVCLSGREATLANTEATEGPPRSTVFFYERMCDAFPGERGIVRVDDPKEALNRLQILLRDPIDFSNYGPIWCLGNFGSSEISEFKILGDSRFLISPREVDLKRIIAYRPEVYWQEFIYLECAGAQRTGLYANSDRSEEYAIWKDRLITREQFDDGAVLIDGKSVSTTGAELRVRRLVPHAYFIVAQLSPLHDPSFDEVRVESLKKLLAGNMEFEDFTALVDVLRKHRRDD